MKKIFIVFFIAGVMMMTGCSAAPLEAVDNAGPPIRLEEFFNGHIKGWGILQDRSGKVTRRFDVDMTGAWKGNVGTLKEHFDYYDGEKQDRVWTITRTADGDYEGTAHDIMGKAEGSAKGSAVGWTYKMDLPVGDTSYVITFDDRMFSMNNGVLINRSYLKKFGFTVAELTLFMQKQKD